MPFTVRSANIDPTKMADNWATGVGRSGQKLADGYAAPRADPRASAVAAVDEWVNNTAAARQKYIDRVGNYDPDKAINTMRTVGAARFAQSGTAKKANFQAKTAALASAIQASLNNLPKDRSSKAARKQRMDSWFDSMGAYKGKI